MTMITSIVNSAEDVLPRIAQHREQARKEHPNAQRVWFFSTISRDAGSRERVVRTFYGYGGRAAAVDAYERWMDPGNFTIPLGIGYIGDPPPRFKNWQLIKRWRHRHERD